MSLSQLPTETIYKILVSLDIDELIRLYKTCTNLEQREILNYLTSHYELTVAASFKDFLVSSSTKYITADNHKYLSLEGLLNT